MIRATGVTLLLAALAFTPPTAAAQSSDRYLGLSLSEALRLLQASGLRIVFTSATVTPGLRVDAEPRARTPRQQLDELLSPHGLEARDGPGGVIQIVRAEPAARGSPARLASESTGTIEGRILHALTGAPLEGAAVLVDGAAVHVRTDADGRFTLRPLHARAWSVRASLPGFGVLTRNVRVLPGAVVNVTFLLSPVLTTHSERVTVSGSRPYWQDRGSTPGTSLDRSDFEQSTGSVVDDPIQSVHALPRVTAADDLRAEFIVRGSPFRHVEVAVDGVETPGLQHTAYGRGAAGSVSMLTSHVVSDATLRVGAYPRRSSDRLGAQLDVTIREGSREQFEVRGAVGGSSATLVGEGPLGGSGARARGSWLAAVRQSFLEWPPGEGAAGRTAFGFSDGLAKLVYDVRPNHRIGFSVVGGTSSADGEDMLEAREQSDGTSLTTASGLFLQSSFGSSLVTQRVSVVTRRFQSTQTAEHGGERGANEELVYRADIARPMFGGLLEAGARVGRATLSGTTHAADEGLASDSPALSAWQRSGYAHFAWSLTPGFVLSPGVRVTDSTLAARASVARWILAEYSFGSRWALNASAGVSHQPPELSHVHGRAPGLPRLRSERATHLDVGIEQRLGAAAQWQATVFRRTEADILREPDLYPRLDGGSIVDPSDPGRYVNSLSGSSQGIELLVQRRTPTGLSGWLAYAYGRTRQADADRHELFWADFDRRHALNVVGVYRVSARTSLGATFRAGSGFPIPAYVASRDGELVVSDQRNQVRLPAYARLDLRASRATEAFGRRLTIYGEVANVLNRVNVGLARGSITAGTGEAVGFTIPMLPRRASAGVLIEF